jgi:hypothetical protein
VSAAEVVDDDVIIELDEPEDVVDGDTPQDAPPVEQKRKRGRPRNQDKPPKPAPGAAKKGRPRKSLKAELEVPLMLAASVFAMTDEFCGQVAMAQVPVIAGALDDWARADERIYNRLAAGAQAGGPVGVLFASSPIIIAVFQHHIRPMLMQQQMRQPQAPPEEETRQWEERSTEGVVPEEEQIYQNQEQAQQPGEPFAADLSWMAQGQNDGGPFGG